MALKSPGSDMQQALTLQSCYLKGYLASVTTKSSKSSLLNTCWGDGPALTEETRPGAAARVIQLATGRREVCLA